ncbi:RNA polymerase sigma-70 factor [Fibrella sp. WM1]|uniref:RNA polymerase sigma-70 factor n=1 Tax=Fibrella musci TaxID=3242485 RepID=UPI003522A3CF
MSNPEGDSTPNAGHHLRPVRPDAERATVIVDNEHLVRAAFAYSPQKGFEALFRLYYGSLCSHAVRFVYTREVAEDIVAEVFYQFWKSERYATVQYSYRTYLYAAVRHRAFNYLRDELTQHRAPTSLEGINEAGQDETPQTLIEYDETFQQVEKVIHELPPQCQRVFLLSRFENRKNQEIADELGLALKTVEAHMARALQALRRVFLPTALLYLLSF